MGFGDLRKCFIIDFKKSCNYLEYFTSCETLRTHFPYCLLCPEIVTAVLARSSTSASSVLKENFILMLAQFVLYESSKCDLLVFKWITSVYSEKLTRFATA